MLQSDLYVDARTVRSHTDLQLVSARRVDDDRRCLLVFPNTWVDASVARPALARLARAHTTIEHALIPRTVSVVLDAPVPFVELDCSAEVDGFELSRRLSEHGDRLPYGAADAFIRSLRIALTAAGEARDPVTERPLFLGRLSPGNVLFSPDGRWFLAGFGHNYAAERASGEVDGSAVFFQAPEVSIGGEPSASGDYVALLLYMRSLIRHVDFATALKNAMLGVLDASSKDIFECLQWIEKRIMGEPVTTRASVEEAVRVADRIRAILGVVLDPEGFGKIVAARLAARAPIDVTVAPDAAWIEGADGKRHRLGAVHRRIVLELLATHPGKASALSVPRALEVGWPGERVLAEAGANRVYVTMNRLRALGLRDALERTEQGYRLAADVRVRRL